MKITGVENDSIGFDLGLKSGDDIARINGQNVRDILDFRYLIAEEDVELEVLKDGQKILFEIEKDYDDDLGLEFEDIQIRYCGNDCPFCFVDQNPAGMRASMYFRDEDFRLSFLSGHYVTLTNLSKRDMDRIVFQQLSPIFVSVHATETEVRKLLFGIDFEDRLLPKLEFLTSNNIEIHTQIVLCPEINDGQVLKNTIWDLAKFLPNLRSVSVVPVGLTKHRSGLKKLNPVTPDLARKYLETLHEYANEFKMKSGENFVYASDEFYIMAGEPMPEADNYDGFYQKENGVGLVRFMLEEFAQQKTYFPERLKHSKTATFVSAKLASGIIQDEIIGYLNKIENFTGKLSIIKNDFYGHSIHVTGLLTGQDIYAQLKDQDLGDAVFLPENCLKDNSIFLDDWTITELSDKLNRPVYSLGNEFTQIFEKLQD